MIQQMNRTPVGSNAQKLRTKNKWNCKNRCTLVSVFFSLCFVYLGMYGNTADCIFAKNSLQVIWYSDIFQLWFDLFLVGTFIFGRLQLKSAKKWTLKIWKPWLKSSIEVISDAHLWYLQTYSTELSNDFLWKIHWTFKRKWKNQLKKNNKSNSNELWH